MKGNTESKMIAAILYTLEINQRELAELLGLSSESTVSRWLSDTSRPSREYTEKLHEILGSDNIRIVQQLVHNRELYEARTNMRRRIENR
ncbi:helix-turn-helix transcriptional regulator [Bacillus sp. SI2]|uniref:helix-turn-helix domain-containing protein n=1 Tax=Bacillus sp. SI2 TaxID=3077323 RepID=UPI0028F15C76|nr:helix-turn-helix transcriptional regulator [Bacillus sp. SI2]WNV19509.1 helix-turn-helix transcriptional regulator [Bacillus sp. SI2]